MVAPIGEDLIQACAHAFVEHLLSPTTANKSVSVIERLFSTTELRSTAPNEKGDILTINVMGFAPDDLPKFTSDTNARLGDLFEALLRIVYRLALRDSYSNEWKIIKTLLPKSVANKKWRADFLAWKKAIDCKYRAANGEGSTRQAATAAILRGLGLHPVMLLLRKSPNSGRYASNGWDIFEDKAALEEIRKDTGVDLELVMKMVGEHPAFAPVRDALNSEVYLRAYAKHRKIAARYPEQFAAARATWEQTLEAA